MTPTLSHPPYWLVFSTGWPDGTTSEMAECAAALAPSFIPARLLTPDAVVVRDMARAVALERGEDVILFADLSGELRKAGLHWPAIGVPDWWQTLTTMQDNAPVLLLTLARYGHILLCHAGMPETTVYTPSEAPGHRVTHAEYTDFRRQLGARLRADWPHYINDLQRAAALQRE